MFQSAFFNYNHLDGIVYSISLFILVLSLLVFVLLLVLTPAPYGRYHNDLKKFILSGDINGFIGWVVMESPNILVPLLILITCEDFNFASIPSANWLLFGMFITHYSHRSLIYPFLQKNKPHTTITVLSAFLYCSTNAFIQSCSLMILHKYDSDWFQHPTTILGTVLWGFGFFTNLYSDYQLRNLRKPGETGYKIPQGFLFNFVSCANYFGEVVEWIGYALATFNIAGLSFAVFTFANLVPRALKHHQYYKEKFDNYPISRKAVIPFIL